MRFLFVRMVTGLWLVLNIACSNIFEGTANKATDGALLEDAVKAQNRMDYDTAIAKIIELQANYPAYQSDVSTKMLLASAYSGKCGFNFIGYFTAVTATAPGSTPLFQWLMSQWTTASTARAYCRMAEDVVKTITPTALGRDANQSFFMVLLGMAKVGIFLREIADLDRNGTADNPPFDGSAGSFCSSANVSDADIAEVGVGLALVVSNLANIGSTLSGADLSSATAFCATLGPPASNPCYIESEATFAADANNVKAIRTALNVNAAGSLGLVNGVPCL